MNYRKIYRLLRRIAQERNIVFDESAPLPKWIDSLWVLDQNIELIALRVGISTKKQAYALAHELGYAHLHRRHIPITLYDGSHTGILSGSEYDKALETEASAYAERLIEKTGH